MITLKSKREIETIRVASRMVTEILEEL
ncbi:MAG: hypothetical protein H6Q06_707, partial [Acidobacteria bacterium]|nr:hypothetical protein [Acidobacteriota bacterium]